MDVPDLGEVMEAFVNAVELTLRDAAQTETALRQMTPQSLPQTGEGLSALLAIESARVDCLVLCFPEATAAALAERVLAGVSPGLIDEAMIRDCAGELANVTAGQAKALLSATPDRLTFATPKVFAGPGHLLREGKSAACHVAEFVCESGAFSMRLYATRESA